VLNANYIRKKLENYYYLPYKQDCLHEVVLSDKKQIVYNNINANDIAKRLIDYKLHPPTIYFPLNVPGAIMIEPTETESKKNLDYLCLSLIEIAIEAIENPKIIKNAPCYSNITRPDEVQALKKPILTWKKNYNGHAPL
jgi:glycine dehydrogenase subunit 2